MPGAALSDGEPGMNRTRSPSSRSSRCRQRDRRALCSVVSAELGVSTGTVGPGVTVAESAGEPGASRGKI